MASQTKDHWTTSLVVVRSLYEFFGRPPHLDPCSNPNSIVGARVEWYGPPHGQDGLILPWPKDKDAYVNPPYSRKDIWMEKCHLQARRGVEIIANLPANTDTAWFRDYGWAAEQRCFWYGRQRFGGDRTYPARFASVLFYWGRRVRRFRSVFKAYGHCC